MPRPLSPERARQLALAHLHLPTARAPGEAGEGPLLALRKKEGEWTARLWLEGERYGQQPRPAADRWLRITAAGQVLEEPPDHLERIKARRRTGGAPGRPKTRQPGDPHQRPRLAFTPDEEDRDEIQRRAKAEGVPEAEIVRRLVRRALGREPQS